jgi:hypothetical protein
MKLGKAIVIGFISVLSVAGWTGSAQAQTGQVAFGKATVEPAVDDATGNTIFLLTPDKAPLPSKANASAIAPLYLVVYPTSSTIPANDLNCQPNNCDHVQVLPFPSPDYGALPGTNSLCLTYNSGNPCSQVKGHDHLVGVPHTGDFNVAWAVYLVYFTDQGFGDGATDTRVLTLDQIQTLKDAGDVAIAPTPIVFNCSIVSPQVYAKGTHLSF